MIDKSFIKYNKKIKLTIDIDKDAMKIKTIVENLILIDSKMIVLSMHSKSIRFELEDIEIEFEINEVGGYLEGKTYKIIKNNKNIKFECYLFDDKASRFGVTNKPARIAKINGEDIYISFLFERKIHQPVYQLIVNFFKEEKDEEKDESIIKSMG